MRRGIVSFFFSFSIQKLTSPDCQHTQNDPDLSPDKVQGKVVQVLLDTTRETRGGSDMGNGKGIIKINKRMANEAEWSERKINLLDRDDRRQLLTEI